MERIEVVAARAPVIGSSHAGNVKGARFLRQSYLQWRVGLQNIDQPAHRVATDWRAIGEPKCISLARIPRSPTRRGFRIDELFVQLLLTRSLRRLLIAHGPKSFTSRPRAATAKSNGRETEQQPGRTKLIKFHRIKKVSQRSEFTQWRSRATWVAKRFRCNDCPAFGPLPRLGNRIINRKCRLRLLLEN